MKAHATGSKPGPKGKGIFRIVPFTNPGKSEAFRVTGWTLDGKRIRENYPTHDEALGRLQELEIQTANLQSAARPIVTRLTPEQAAEAESVYAQLEGKSLLAVLRFYQDNYKEPLVKSTVADAFTKFIANKKAKNKRPLTIRNLELKCSELLKQYGKRLVSDITRDQIEALIEKDNRTATTRDNYRRAFSGFFNWAKSMKYTPSSPIDEVGIYEVDATEPKALTLAESQALMQAAASYKEGKLVPFVALALFAGLRPDQELARIGWADINFNAESITVSAKVAKTRGKRVVEAARLTNGKDEQGKDILLPSNLFQWLAPYADKKPAIKGANWRRDFDAVKRLAGFGSQEEGEDKPKLKPWVQDYMRHTAISYHLALYEHEGKTAIWAGNSPDIIQRKYKDLVQKQDVPKFWSIAPTAPANLIKLNQKEAA